MVAREAIRFGPFYTRFRVDFDNNLYAYVGYCHDADNYVVAIGETGRYGRTLFGSGDVMGPIYGFEDMFTALHEMLDKLGLEGFPADPVYVLNKIQQPRPPQFKDMGENGTTVEEYLATLDEHGNPR